jgi:hypothetical protein
MTMMSGVGHRASPQAIRELGDAKGLAALQPQLHVNSSTGFSILHCQVGTLELSVR